MAATAAAIAWNINRELYLGQFYQIHHALGDVDCLIADAFQVGVNFGNGENEAQIDRHGLLHGQKIESQLVDFALGGVDEGFALEYSMATCQIAVDVGLAGAIHGLLG